MDLRFFNKLFSLMNYDEKKVMFLRVLWILFEIVMCHNCLILLLVLIIIIKMKNLSLNFEFENDEIIYVALGMYVANRASDKITQLTDNVYLCRSGSVTLVSSNF